MLLSWRGSSASSTTGMPRFSAATHTSLTKPGNRLSAITASAFATSAAASLGRAAISASSRKLTIARSPIEIAEIGDVMPSTRGQSTHAMPSRPASASIVSPTLSAPAGPPNGPEKVARAPRCPIATAAFAALPPLTLRNSLAWVFTSGRGWRSTRKTRSSTAIPVHTMCLRVSAEDTITLFDPCADDMMRDRDRRRNTDPFRVSAHEHQRDLVAREPARVLKLLAVDRDVGVDRLRVTADHQRHREGPRLGGEILYASAGDAGFFQRFAPSRFLDVLTRLDKARKARPHVGDEASGAPEQT